MVLDLRTEAEKAGRHNAKGEGSRGPEEEILRSRGRTLQETREPHVANTRRDIQRREGSVRASRLSDGA